MTAKRWQSTPGKKNQMQEMLKNNNHKDTKWRVKIVKKIDNPQPEEERRNQAHVNKHTCLRYCKQKPMGPKTTIWPQTSGNSQKWARNQTKGDKSVKIHSKRKEQKIHVHHKKIPN